MRRESDELRAAIQRTLLEAARLPATPQAGAAVCAAPAAGSRWRRPLHEPVAAPVKPRWQSPVSANEVPKCHYIGFGSIDRCRNCGYEFCSRLRRHRSICRSRAGDQTVGPLADFVLTERGLVPPTSSSPDARAPGPAASVAPRRRAVPSRLDLPLFGGPAGRGRGG